MRREDYERSYGRRGLPPPTAASSQESRRSRKSRRKMKCLISIGLILPALAAVIGVAAWAVSADVVMNSGSNGNRVNKGDNELLQGLSADRNDDRRDIFRNNQDLQNLRVPDRSSHSFPRDPSDGSNSRPTPSTMSPRRIPSSSTLSPQESTDVSAILSKLISASGAASGGSGPRFVVVAPLPDHAKVVARDDTSSSTIARADHQPTDNTRYQESWKPNRYNTQNEREVQNNGQDLAPAASQNYHQIQPQTYQPTNNITNRVGLSSSAKPSNQRRSGDQPFVINLSTKNHRGGFNSQPMELSGFEPFMSPETLLGSQSMHIPGPPPPPPGFMAAGPFTNNRGPSQEFFNKPPKQNFFESNHPQVFNPHQNDHLLGGKPVFDPNPLPGFNPGPNPGFGLKPIQQHLHHHDNGNNGPPRADESNRWGAVSFHGPPSAGYAIEQPKGISLSLSSPSAGGHSSEPVSMIKSFFLPFLPKPRMNMNARVVFGVVLDKGLGFGGKKDAGHLHHPPY